VSKPDHTNEKRLLTSATYGGGLTFDGDESVAATESYTPAQNKRSAWSIAALIVAAIVCLPLLSVVWLAFFPEENIWPHLFRTVLSSYVLNTLVLMLGVAMGTLVIGTTTAWLVTHYDFPGRTLFNWALLLPFAVPAYVIAYVYTDLLEFAGPVQTLVRGWFGWTLASDYYFPAIRTLPGAIIMMILVLYPYVYLLARAAFLEQSASIAEAARSLGVSRTARIFHVALPMARPAIVVGLSLVMMETLNDYGTVDYFAVRTLTAGLYDTWLGMNNLGGGAQIATLLLVFVMVLIGLEKSSRRNQQNFQPASSRFRLTHRTRLTKLSALFATVFCALPVILGFVIPAWVLGSYTISYFDESWNRDFHLSALHSIGLSSVAALAAVCIGVLLAYSKRLHPSRNLLLLITR